ncbi:MAG: aldo/keto reductase [Thermoanaerobaculia bacterium]|jgi:aryl-alcohol dehydrogenase-like predicted oxidoreductase
MRTTALGTTGITIPIHGFGAMPLSIQGRPDEATAKGVLHAAIDAGMTLVDTANVYCIDDDDIGHNERLIASVLAERDDRDRIVVATKGGLRRPRGAWLCDGAPKKLRLACEASLRALEVERITLYQFHAPDPDVAFETSVEELARLRDEAKIAHVGLSNVSVAQLRSAQTIVPVVSVQNRFSPWFREAEENGVIAECERARLTFLAYSPLGGKRLSARIGSIPSLVAIGHEHGVTPEAVTLAWGRAKGSCVVPIPGASRVDHALDSARAMLVELTPEQVARIDAERFAT